MNDKSEFYNTGTDLLKFDSDNDGLGDGTEINNYETNPLDSDSDNDGLKDGEDINKNCDPLKADTDNDGYNDYSDLFCYKNARIRLIFTYLSIDTGFDPLGNGDPYIRAQVYNDEWKTYESDVFDIGNDLQVYDPYTTEFIDIPDNSRDVSIRLQVFDYDPGTHDEADINPNVDNGGYSFSYDITSESLNMELNGDDDGIYDQYDAVLRFKIETS